MNRRITNGPDDGPQRTGTFGRDGLLVPPVGGPVSEPTREWPPTDPTLELRVAVRHLICAISGVAGKGHRWMNADTHRMCVRCLRTQYRPTGARSDR